jgi:nucleotide-binding universal stress UspA family protein
MSNPPAATVVVGIDTSQNSRAALEWAADEARLRGAVLRIGHSWSMQPYRLPEAEEHDMAEESRKAAREFLDATTEELRRRRPGLRVESELLEDAPIDGLLRMAAADGTRLVVTGRRGLNPFLRFLLGSVSESIVAHSPVPAVVVPVEGAADPHGPVVVGVAPSAAGPVEFAFEEAERRGVPLKVVRIWNHAQTFSEYIAVPPEYDARQNAAESKDLEALLAPSRAQHPAVTVDVHVEPGLAEEAIVKASKGASLVVVGAHRKHTSRFSLPVGRVPHRVLHLAHAPVAVVPDATARARTRA